MPKYLFQVSYTTEGVKGLLKEGGTKRRAAAQQVVAAVGGKIEAMYFAFGDQDAYVIADAPDDASAAALSLALNASGAVSAKTVPLLTPEQLDEATKKTVSYRPPGA